MSQVYALPDLTGITKLLSTLVGREVQVTGATQALATGAVGATGVYADRDGAVRAVCMVDRPLAAYLGAALSMIPPGAAADAVKDEALPEGIVENLHEVFNICVGLFNQGEAPYIRFAEMHLAPDAACGPVGAIEGAGPARLDASVTVPGYGTGRLSLLAA